GCASTVSSSGSRTASATRSPLPASARHDSSPGSPSACSYPAWPSSSTPARQSRPGCGPPTVPTTPPSTNSPATPGSPPDHVPATSENDSPPPDLTHQEQDH